ncbi:ATP-binding protein [Bradyrhizobium genomosp. III]|uniref:ATP-binding protein n=1 Tax=Bradyrhizobium genomosp. III TaxID=2683271 RepID=UPI0004AC9708|nr:ATP-binding protein [Bradyrhizobium sp. CCBAU 15635]
MTIARTFRDLSDKEIADIGSANSLVRLGWTGGFGWDELLKSPRVLIVSEAGVGKTHECRAQRDLLWSAGAPAFFLELATLARGNVREMLDPDEEARLDVWLRSQSETATFFLDSIDELELTMGSFEQALIRLKKAIAGQLGRARIVITTRPIPLDERLIRKHLPIPQLAETEPTAEAFADMMMNVHQRQASTPSAVREWRTVGLMPLSLEQARELAVAEGVTDPDALIADIKQRDAEDFAGRPMDLIELCADWREYHRIRTHKEQVTSNVETKLKPRIDRSEKSALSPDRAIEGVSRLALAAMLTRRLSLRYSAESDNTESSDAALDVGKTLTNWTVPEWETLLERPLFGFATYGRVRFHHRSVVEFLAAKRLNALLERGVPVKSIKRLLFTETAQGEKVVRPSMRPVAAWLGSWRDDIFEEIRDREPDILLDHGDPQSLRPAQRAELLEQYVKRYGLGGWRGLSVPRIQVFRVASPDLAPVVTRLWAQRIENPEVRGLLLEVIEAGKLSPCCDICFASATNSQTEWRERLAALEALIALNDPRLSQISEAVERNAADWPGPIAKRAMLALFPKHLDADRLCKILARVSESPGAIAEITWQLPRLIQQLDLSSDQLSVLREGLADLISAGLSWDTNRWPHIGTSRPDLISSLISCCVRELSGNDFEDHAVKSASLALRLCKEERRNDEAKKLRQILSAAPSEVRERAFWADAELVNALHPQTDHWHWLYEIIREGGVGLIPEKDAGWVRATLKDKNADIDRRTLMLWAEMIELPAVGLANTHLEELKACVGDQPSLVAIIEERQKQREPNPEYVKMEADHQKRMKKAERDDAKAHASWVAFWKEIAENPEKMFAKERADDTAWNLWQAMERSGGESRSSGWDRQFIEKQFGKDVADRLRDAMIAFWRKDKPTLRSEREEGKKNTYLVRWTFGLAAITAEAEDPQWAAGLSDEEARIAARYAPLQLNGFPSWLEALIETHPIAVDATLGEELSLSLQETVDTDSHSIFLQNIRHGSAPVISLFSPRIRAWLDSRPFAASNSPEMVHKRLLDVVEILLRSGDPAQRTDLAALAERELLGGLNAPFAKVWLSVLLELDPEKGVVALERGLLDAQPSARNLGVEWFGALFGRERVGTLDLRNPLFTPALLLRLVRLAYKHVRLEEDARHEGAYSPDARDNAETGRDAILKAILATAGNSGWAAKLEMAEDPLFSNFKDRAKTLAKESSAIEADGQPMTDEGVIALDQYGETPPTTRDGMFDIMRDRLDDIDDLLKRDTSPRAAWAGITDEKVLRREIARTLSDKANHLYTVDQEGVTADEKETDIRLRSTAASQQAVVELKIGEQPRSAGVLRAALKDQLLKKYMSSDECRAGCLYISVASDRTWRHPDTGKKLDLDGLVAMLNEEADRIAADLGGSVRLSAKGLDLRPRLPPENVADGTK